MILLTWLLVGLTPVAKTPQVAIHGVYFQVEIARSEEEWRKGLMFREKLAPQEGMLFVSKVERQQSFWMKNTLIPLDIVFISKDKKVVSIFKNAKPLSEAQIPSGMPAQYVLEILGGQANAAKIRTGDQVTFINIPD